MVTETTSLALVVVGLLFAAFILLKLYRPAAYRTAEWREAKRKIGEAKRRARDKAAPPERRALAWREAAIAALEGLKRPSLAASYAHRAEVLLPDDAEAVGLLARSLRRAARYRALERFLWRRLAAPGSDQTGPGYERAFAELLKLYDGPMRRREIADALRSIRNRPPATS